MMIQKLHTPSPRSGEKSTSHALDFGLQLSRCQNATGALNNRNTSATVKLKPLEVSRPLKSGGFNTSENTVDGWNPAPVGR